MNSKQKNKNYYSLAEWKEELFPGLVRDRDLEELRKDSGQLGIRLANESFEKIKNNKEK